MECYPPCRTCTGLCRAEVPVRRVAPSQGKAGRKKPVPGPGYIVLVCGQYSTAETQREWFQRAGKQWPRNLTRRTRFWCELHSAWTPVYTMTDRVKAMKQDEQIPF